MKRIKIRDFTKPELDYFREMCNFTPDELQYFNLRSKDVQNVQIALKMNVSTAQVSILARRVIKKIIRVL